jgi:predicted lipid-binding transport protein (Tim44 family)
MALVVGGSSTDAGNFSGALITGIVVGIIVVTLIGGLIFFTALYWRDVARKVAPNKFQTPQSEKAWPKAPRQSLEKIDSTASSSPTLSRQDSARKNGPAFSKAASSLAGRITIPSMVFGKPFSGRELQTRNYG